MANSYLFSNMEKGVARRECYSEVCVVCARVNPKFVRERILSDRDQANQAYIAHSGYGDTKRELAR